MSSETRSAERFSSDMSTTGGDAVDAAGSGSGRRVRPAPRLRAGGSAAGSRRVAEGNGRTVTARIVRQHPDPPSPLALASAPRTALPLGVALPTRQRPRQLRKRQRAVPRSVHAHKDGAVPCLVVGARRGVVRPEGRVSLSRARGGRGGRGGVRPGGRDADGDLERRGEGALCGERGVLRRGGRAGRADAAACAGPAGGAWAVSGASRARDPSTPGAPHGRGGHEVERVALLIRVVLIMSLGRSGRVQRREVGQARQARLEQVALHRLRVRAGQREPGERGGEEGGCGAPLSSRSPHSLSRSLVTGPPTHTRHTRMIAQRGLLCKPRLWLVLLLSPTEQKLQTPQPPPRGVLVYCAARASVAASGHTPGAREGRTSEGISTSPESMASMTSCGGRPSTVQPTDWHVPRISLTPLASDAESVFLASRIVRAMSMTLLRRGEGSVPRA